MQPTAEQIEQDLLRPLFHSSAKYWVAVAIATSLLLAGVAAMIGIVPFVYAALSGYLLVLFCWDFLSGWLHPTVADPA